MCKKVTVATPVYRDCFVESPIRHPTGNLSALVLLDQSMAFIMVDRDILIGNHVSYGLSGLVQTYLISQHQYVRTGYLAPSPASIL